MDIHEQFAGAPWRTIVSDELRDAEALTFPEERQLGAWLARDYFTGRGEIIDAGAFFGGSALSFAVGLSRNERVAREDRVGRIHSFDTFEWLPWITKKFLPENVRFGSSFLDRYHETVRKYDTLITIHPGDIIRQTWRGGPIEILFIDCAKSYEANNAIMKLFFPSLTTGSIIVQQDYAIVSRLVWIHAAMEFLAGNFSDLGCTRIGGSTIFRVEKPITAQDVSACQSALKSGLIPLARAAADRFDATDRRRAAVLGSIEKFEEAPLPIPI